jgi:hypothetical protein
VLWLILFRIFSAHPLVAAKQFILMQLMIQQGNILIAGREANIIVGVYSAAPISLVTTSFVTSIIIGIIVI